MLPAWLPLGLASAFFAALVAILGKIGLDKVDSTLATTVRAAVMFVTLVLIAGATGKLHQLATITGRPLVFIILAGIAGALSWLFYFWGLKVSRAAPLAAMDRLSIVFVVVLAALFLGEKLTWKAGLGSALVVVGAVLISIK